MPLFQDISSPDFDRIREVLHRLAANPPQVLLLEGGTEPQRLATARYWAACVNCQQPGGEGGPCLICPTCMQIDAGEHLDVLAYDGRISNADDEAHPGPIRALNMDNIRELKQKLRDAPHGQGRRVVLLMGVEQNRSNAANALLKALEEPSPSSCFVLLAAQREQLLPTLVSRSLCLTLPWPDSLSRDPALQPWEEALALFITSGRGLFERTGARNALDARLAGQILLACQKSMSRVMSGNDDALCPLDTALALLPREKRVQCCFWFNEAQEALGFNVTPARVLEALAARLGEQYPAAVVTGLPVGRFLMNAGVQKGRSPFTVQRVKIGRSYPGTGDLFGSILVGALLEGQALSAAADLAADFVADAIAAPPEEADSRFGVQFEPMLGRLAKR